MKAENRNANYMLPHKRIYHYHRPTPTPRTAPPAHTRTHLVLGIHVGAGIQQQPHAVRVTPLGGPNQWRLSVLCTRVHQCVADEMARA